MWSKNSLFRLISFSTGGHVIIVLIVMAAVTVSTSENALADVGPSVLILNPGIRSYSMGNVGVADCYDPANAYINPAAIAFRTDFSFMGSFSELVPDLVEDVYILNLGFAGKLFSAGNNDIRYGLAGSIRYSYLSYGKTEFIDDLDNPLGSVPSWEQGLSLTAAFNTIYNELVYFGIGLSAKPLFVKLAPQWATIENTDGRGNGIAFDTGAVLKAEFLKQYDFLLSPALGISYLNFGTGITYINRDQKQQFPKNFRVGFGLRLESPSIERIDDIFKRKVPFLTVAYNKDVCIDQLSDLDRSNVKGSGWEIGHFQTIFIRGGYIEDRNGAIIGDTSGVGINLFYKSVQIRLDYANVPQTVGLDRVDKYGISVDFAF